MAGNGPPPKDPSRRARRNAEPVPVRIIEAEPSEQPTLPTFYVEADGALVEFVWPARTVEWWAMWASSPLSAEFTETDWSELLDTALLHASFWRGGLKLAGELRLRVAKFGATPEDRARLRIQFAAAAGAEAAQGTRASSRSRTDLRLAE
jgi:hypothetical protein